VVGGIQLLNIPVSYYLLKMGAAPEITVAVAIALSQVCLFARLVMLNRATGFPIFGFISKVYIKSVLVVMPLAMSVPLIFDMYKPAGLWGTVVSVAVCIVWTALIIYFVGTDREEKGMLKGLLTKRREG